MPVEMVDFTPAASRRSQPVTILGQNGRRQRGLTPPPLPKLKKPTGINILDYL